VVLLGYEARVKTRFGPFRDNANLDARWVHSLRRMYHQAWKSIWTHPMELLGDMGCVESRIGPFKDGVSVGVRCTICAKLTLSSKIILETLDGTPR
jgi:hypothetical protein